MKQIESNTVAIVGLQYGNEPTEGITRKFAKEWASIVVHSYGIKHDLSVYALNGERWLHDDYSQTFFDDGVVNVITHGCILDLAALGNTISRLRANGVNLNNDNLKISDRCHIVLNINKHTDFDLNDSRGNNIADTPDGSASCLANKCFRIGLRVCDIISNPSIAVTAVHNMFVSQNINIDPNEIDNIVSDLFRDTVIISEFLDDTESYLNNAIKENKKVLFTGPGSTMLDVDNGDYPYVCPMNTTTAAMSVGSGVAPKYFSHVIGVIKPYISCRKDVPLCTEIEDNHLNKEMLSYVKNIECDELTKFGWLDVSQLKKAIRINGVTELAIGKLDVLLHMRNIKICTGFHFDDIREKTLASLGTSVYDSVSIVPQYKEFEIPCGVKTETYDALPDSFKDFICMLEEELGVPVRYIENSEIIEK